MFKLKYFISFKVLLIIYIFVWQSYQQTITTTNKKDLTFCIQNHTTSNTLQTFWHEANADCELDTKRVLELYSQLLEVTTTKVEDQCSAILKHHMRKKLIEVVATQLEEAFVLRTLKTNTELRRTLKNLQDTDERLAQFIWERVVHEVHFFVTPEEFLNDLRQLKEPQLQILALKSFLNKYMVMDAECKETLLPLLTFHICSLLKKETNAAVPFINKLQSVYHRLPIELRFLYESSAEQTIGLLNYQHKEYLYAPRDNGPDSERRLPLTWSKIKNSTDSDGHLVVTFNAKGLVSFGNRFGASLKYLYADEEHQAAYFWIGTGLKTSQWWQVIWSHDSVYSYATLGHILLQNDVTKELLCATREYDENRRYVTLRNAKENMDYPACYWLITKF